LRPLVGLSSPTELSSLTSSFLPDQKRKEVEKTWSVFRHAIGYNYF